MSLHEQIHLISPPKLFVYDNAKQVFLDKPYHKDTFIVVNFDNDPLERAAESLTGKLQAIQKFMRLNSYFSLH